MSDYCIENDFAAQREIAEREGDTIAKLRAEVEKQTTEIDHLRSERDSFVHSIQLLEYQDDQLRADMTKIKGLVENILVTHVEGREFMTSSQLYEAVIQDCTAALNVGR